MADQFVQVPADGVGKKVDTSELTVGANTVERQRVVLADDATAAAVTKVRNDAQTATDYGIVTRPVAPSGAPLRVDPTGTTLQPVNVSQVAGTAPDVNSGLKGAGTLRVVIATDQPQLTAKLLVTPDSVALPANQSVNVAQIGGSAAVTGVGASGAGIPRVTIANDSQIRALGNAGATLDSSIGAATAPTNALATSHVYQSTIPALTAGQAVAQQCDTTGSLYVQQEGRKATYRMSVRGFTPVASASAPLFSIQGSASKTVRLIRVKVSWSCSTGTALPNDISLQKFSALSGGTTGNTPTGALNDTNNAAQTAICLQYSAVPTTATVIGGISEVERMHWITAGATVSSVLPLIEWIFGTRNQQQLVLRGTSEFYGVVCAAVGTTPVMSITVEWEEE